MNAASVERWPLGSACLSMLLALAPACHRPPDLCDSPQKKLVGLWDAQVRDSARAAFATTAVSGVEATYASVEQDLDRAAAAWVAAEREACQATRSKHLQSESELGPRLACLDRQLLDYKAVTDLLRHMDKPWVAASGGLATSLPLPAACADGHALSLIAPPAPAQQPRVDDLREAIARGRALRAGDRDPAALEILGPAARDAVALGYRPVAAEALLALALVRADQGDQAAAAAAYRQAAEAAHAAHADALAAHAAAAAVWALSETASSTDLDQALAEARVFGQPVSGSPLIGSDLELAAAFVAATRGLDAEAVTHDRRSLELLRPVVGLDSPALLAPLDDLATDLESVGGYPEALTTWHQAIALADRLYHPSDRYVCGDWEGLAAVLSGLGRREDAIRAARHVVTGCAAVDDEATATALAIEALELSAESRGTEAAEALRALRDLDGKLGDTASAGFRWANQFAAEALILQGQPAAAIERFEAARVAARALPEDSPDWVGALRVGGAAYLAAGQPAKALELLERALRLCAAHPFYPTWIAELRFHLAQALVATGGDRDRAAALASQARDALAAVPEAQAQVGAIDAWRAKAFAPVAP